MTEFTNEQAAEELKKKADSVTDDDIRKVLGREDDIEQKFRNAGPLEKFWEDIKLLLAMIRDYWNGDYREVPWTTIAAAVGALLYVLSPIDLIPDFIPVIGYMDDAAVVALCLKAIISDLDKYKVWKEFGKVN